MLSDEQWEAIADLLPARTRRRGRPFSDVRSMVEGVVPAPVWDRVADDLYLVPPPQPLAVITSGLPIVDVVAQLEKLQQTYPDAEVRRGRAGRLELWPRKQGIELKLSSLPVLDAG